MADRWVRTETSKAHRILYMSDGNAYTLCGRILEGMPKHRLRITSGAARIDQCTECSRSRQAGHSIVLVDT